MLAKSVLRGEWPDSRKETFEQACRMLVLEPNGEHLAAKPSSAETGPLIEAAGRLSAAQLLSGVAGYTLPDRAVPDGDFPSLAEVDGEAGGRTRDVLGTRLFLGTFEGKLAPLGLGLGTPDILTKMSIRRLEIDKGSRRRLYFPDYMVVIAGLPVVVVEAKAPSESLGLALDEARLYGNEINALFPSGINPCIRVVVCNGHELWSGPLDSAQPDITLNHVNISPSNVEYSVFVDQAQRSALQQHADGIRRRFRRPKYLRPLSEVGGDARQNQELPTNTFGSTIVGDFGHLFSPQTKQDRELIARHAYIPSLRRRRCEATKSIVTPNELI